MFAFKPGKTLKIEASIAGVLFVSAVVFALEPTREFLLGSVIEKQFAALEQYSSLSRSLDKARISSKDLDYIIATLDRLNSEHPGFIFREDTALLKARAYEKAGKTSRAADTLGETLLTASDPLVRMDAALALSRILAARGEHARALSVLEANRSASPFYRKNEYAMLMAGMAEKLGRTLESGRHVLRADNPDQQSLPLYIRTVRANWSAYSPNEQRLTLRVLSRLRAYQTYAELASWFFRTARPSFAEAEEIALDIVYNSDKPFIRPFLAALKTANRGAYEKIHDEMSDLYRLSSGTIRSRSGAVRGSYYLKQLKLLSRHARYNDRKAMTFMTNYLQGEVDARYVRDNLRYAVRNLLAFRNYEGITNIAGMALDALELDGQAGSVSQDISFWHGYACHRLGDTGRAVLHYQNAVAKVPDGYYAIQARNFIEDILELSNATLHEYIRDLEKRHANARNASDKLRWGRILYAWTGGTDRMLLREKIADYEKVRSENPLFHFDNRVLSRIKGSDQYVKFMVHVRFGMTDRARAVLSSSGVTDTSLQDLVILQQMVRNRDFRRAWPLFASLSRTEAVEEHFAFLSRDLQTLFYPTPYDGEIALALDRLDSALVDRYLVYAVIRGESMYVPDAKSRVGARGLMQLMPSTARLISRNAGGKRPDLNDPSDNITLGTAYLNSNVKTYGFLTAIASYNGGIGIIRKTDRRFSPPNELELLEIIPYAETRDYLKKILSYYARYKNLYDTAGLNASELKARVGG